MYRRGDKEKMAAKLVAESREHRGVCGEGDTTNLPGQGKPRRQASLAATPT